MKPTPARELAHRMNGLFARLELTLDDPTTKQESEAVAELRPICEDLYQTWKSIEPLLISKGGAPGSRKD